MSIERWLHMTHRSLLTARRGCFIVAAVFLLLTPVVVGHFLHKFRHTLNAGLVLNAISGFILLFCLIATSIAYFKVFQVIRRHQKQIQGNGWSQNLAGQPAINLVKFKKSVFSILYILAVLYLGFVPFLVFTVLLFSHRYSELKLAFNLSFIVLFLSPSINPLIYLWRMNGIRNAVRQLLKRFLSKEN